MGVDIYKCFRILIVMQLFPQNNHKSLTEATSKLCDRGEDEYTIFFP